MAYATLLKKKIKFYGIKKIPFKYDKKELQAGMKVEREHTNDKRIARAIAIAHLGEDRNYYKKLRKAKL